MNVIEQLQNKKEKSLSQFIIYASRIIVKYPIIFSRF